MNSPNPFNFRALCPAHLRLPVLRKVGDGNNQPDDHGKPDNGDNKLEEGFYKFHTAGDLHYPPRAFNTYINRFLLLFARKKHDGDDQSKNQRKQCDRGNKFNKEFHSFQKGRRQKKNELFREAIKRKGLNRNRFQN